MTQAFEHSIDIDKKNNTFHFITKNFENVFFVSMTRYYPNYKLNIFVENENIKNTL